MKDKKIEPPGHITTGNVLDDLGLTEEQAKTAKEKYKKSSTDKLIEFFEEHKDIEVSFQGDRDFTDPKKLSRYILKLEGAVRHFSGKRLDAALYEYKNRKSK